MIEIQDGKSQQVDEETTKLRPIFKEHEYKIRLIKRKERENAQRNKELSQVVLEMAREEN